MAYDRQDPKEACSFCGKSYDSVRRLIQGGHKTFICDECVELCYSIIKQESLRPRLPQQVLRVPNPAEIKQKLSALVEQKQATSAETSHDNFKRFFDDGFSRYRAGDFEGALASWEQAYSINPTDKSLETNIRIVRKKLGL